MKRLAAIFILSVFILNCAQPPKDPLAGTWVDLSHDFGEDTIYWVTAEPFKRTTVAEGKTDGGYYYSAYNFSGGRTGAGAKRHGGP